MKVGMVNDSYIHLQVHLLDIFLFTLFVFK